MQSSFLFRCFKKSILEDKSLSDGTLFGSFLLEPSLIGQMQSWEAVFHMWTHENAREGNFFPPKYIILNSQSSLDAIGKLDLIGKHRMSSLGASKHQLSTNKNIHYVFNAGRNIWEGYDNNRKF